VAELARELEGAPEELTAGGGASGMDTSGGKRQLRQLEARAAVEEDLMMRVPLSKVRLEGRFWHTHLPAHRYPRE